MTPSDPDPRRSIPDGSQDLDFDAMEYLRQYWPEFPSESSAWQDNVFLMDAYQDAGLAIRRLFRGARPLSLLDIGTGPALAPLLAISTEIETAQLSDYHAHNREALVRMPIDYWRNYVPLLKKVVPNPVEYGCEILSKLDRLRSQSEPLAIDLFAEDPWQGRPLRKSFDVVSMNFVADSISRDSDQYFAILDRVCTFVSPGCALTMSAIVDAEYWCLAGVKHPSPEVSEE
jgi:hypothetical protein